MECSIKYTYLGNAGHKLLTSLNTDNICRYCKRSGRSLDEVKKAGYEVGVIWQDGRPFHGPHHIRMNLALPTARVEEAMQRLKDYVFV